MQQVKFNKQMQQAYNAYKWSDKVYLSECYTNASIYKYNAYSYCRELQRKYNGYEFRIIGYDCMTFSVGFCYDDENGNTHFVYITKSYDRDCIVE